MLAPVRITMNKGKKNKKSGQIKGPMIWQWGRISKIMIVLPDSGSMTAASVCGTSKYNILKERASVFYQ